MVEIWYDGDGLEFFPGFLVCGETASSLVKIHAQNSNMRQDSVDGSMSYMSSYGVFSMLLCAQGPLSTLPNSFIPSVFWFARCLFISSLNPDLECLSNIMSTLAQCLYTVLGCRSSPSMEAAVSLSIWVLSTHLEQRVLPYPTEFASKTRTALISCLLSRCLQPRLPAIVLQNRSDSPFKPLRIAPKSPACLKPEPVNQRCFPVSNEHVPFVT